MKVLIYTTSANLNPHNGVLLDTAEEYIKAGHEVAFLLCGGGLQACFSNPLKDITICSSCKLQHKFLLKKLSKKVKIYFLSDIKKTPYNFSYNSPIDIHNINYKGVDIGAGAMSTYITITRNLNPKLTPEFRIMMDQFLECGVFLTDAIKDFINHIKPDLICLFNGRFFEARPILRVAQQEYIQTHVYEVIGNPGEYKKVIFENTLPHDISYNTKLIEQVWSTSPLSEQKKTEIGSTFYVQKKDGKAVGDKAYVKDQEFGSLPKGWNPLFKNIVIFNSSEDEFAAVGKEYQEKLFPSQIDGIRYILEKNLPDKNIKFYLRIHPNLKNIQYKYNLDLLKFNEYDNCEVIVAESKISTYTLMDNADRIVVFGSSTGIEGCYWGKPTILLCASFYKDLDVAYYPISKDELQVMLTTPIEPKNNLNAIKYGFFLNGDRGEKYKFFDFNPSGFRFLSSYQKYHNSVKLYYTILILPFSCLMKIKNVFKKNKISVDEG